MLDPSIDNGKRFAAKVLKESSDLQENGNLTSPAFIPSTGRRAFPSNNIPSLLDTWTTMDTCITTRWNLFR